MTRSFFAVVLVGVAGMALLPAFLQGCSQTGVGDPCTPEQEYDPTFLGFNANEVNVESKSFDCQTRLCLANHFQGRVTCPYGQSKTGGPPKLANTGGPYLDLHNDPVGACVLPGGGVDTTNGQAPSSNGISQAVIGSVNNPTAVANGTATAAVPAQCLDRTASQAVYCSCRCANVNGRTDDGAVYCACPDGFTCEPLVTPIGLATNEGLTGAYCIKAGSKFDSLKNCQPGANCDASLASTPSANGKGFCGAFNGR